MPAELPPKEIIEAKIAHLNKQLSVFEPRARKQGAKPVDIESLPTPSEQYTQIYPAATPAWFWNHHIGGPMAAVDVEMYLLQETGHMNTGTVRHFQARLYRLTRNWLEMPQCGDDPLNTQTTAAFLKGGFSFDWTKCPALTSKLKDCITKIGNSYTMRERYYNPV